MKHVFISYSHLDRSDAVSLKLKLESMGIQVWYDNELKAGTNWKQNIDGAIADSFAFILIKTPNSRESDYVNYEWAYAMGKDIRVIPVIFDEKNFGDNWHAKIDDLQYFNFSHGVDDRRIDDLFELLQNLEKGITIYVPTTHVHFTDIKDIFDKNKLDYQSYTQLSEVGEGIVVGVVADDSEAQVFLDAYNQLDSELRDKIHVIIYSPKRLDSLFDEFNKRKIPVRQAEYSLEPEIMNKYDEIRKLKG